jgi:hypothetical protein
MCFSENSVEGSPLSLFSDRCPTLQELESMYSLQQTRFVDFANYNRILFSLHQFKYFCTQAFLEGVKRNGHQVPSGHHT